MFDYILIIKNKQQSEQRIKTLETLNSRKSEKHNKKLYKEVILNNIKEDKVLICNTQ